MSKTVELARHLETLHINNMYKNDFYWTWDKTDEEIDAARPVIGTLGGEPPFVMDYRLPGEDGYRRIVTVYKKGPTPKAYPRKWSKIKEAKFVPPAEDGN